MRPRRLQPKVRPPFQQAARAGDQPRWPEGRALAGPGVSRMALRLSAPLVSGPPRRLPQSRFLSDHAGWCPPRLLGVQTSEGWPAVQRSTVALPRLLAEAPLWLAHSPGPLRRRRVRPASAQLSPQRHHSRAAPEPASLRAGGCLPVGRLRSSLRHWEQSRPELPLLPGSLPGLAQWKAGWQPVRWAAADYLGR